MKISTLELEQVLQVGLQLEGSISYLGTGAGTPGRFTARKINIYLGTGAGTPGRFTTRRINIYLGTGAGTPGRFTARRISIFIK